jgi:hypothetical protein
MKLQIIPTHVDGFGNKIISDSHVDIEVEDHNLDAAKSQKVQVFS